MKNRSGHDLRSLGKSHPEDKDELEGVVEWEPVNGVNGRLITKVSTSPYSSVFLNMAHTSKTVKKA